MGFLRRYVFHDIGLKLFSLLMATCLWAVVTQDHAVISAPVEVRGIPENLELSSPLPTARLTVRGPSRLLNHLDGNVRVQIDLADAHAGEQTVLLSSRSVHVPEGVWVSQIVPQEVHMTLAARQTRLVDVQPRVVGRLVSGFSITKVVTDPKQVTITGPSKDLESVDAVITDSVDATGLLSQRTFAAKVYVSDPLVKVVAPQPVRVTVFVGKSSSRGD